MKYLPIFLLVILLTSCPPPPPINIEMTQNVDLPDIDIRTYNVNEINQLIENGNKVLVELRLEKIKLEKEEDELRNSTVIENKEILQDLTKSKEAVDVRISKYEAYLNKLNERKNISSTASETNYEFLIDLEPSDFNHFIDLSCGDEISKAFEVLGNSYRIVEGASSAFRDAIFKYRNKEVVSVMYYTSNRRIKSVKVSLFEGVEFLRSRQIEDQKFNIIGIKMAKVVETFGTHPEDVDNHGFSIYDLNPPSIRWSEVGFRNLEEDYFNVSEIYVEWHYQNCSL